MSENKRKKKQSQEPPEGYGSIAEYAKLRNVSRNSANRFVKQYSIKKTGKWINFSEIDDARGILPDEVDKPENKKLSSDSARLTKLRADILATKSKSDDLKFKELEGKLISFEALQAGLNDVMQSVRKEIIDLPNKMTPQVAACENEKEIFKILTQGANEVLTRLYELKNIGKDD